ncbi:MAG: FkbM family methyltransferase [Acidiferrobacteraceae bacterium]
MAEGTEPQIQFDRKSRVLKTSNARSRLQARLMQISNQVLAPIGYLGVSRVHAMINSVLRPDGATCVAEGAASFTFPSNDYYWNRLLDPTFEYEPEIDSLLCIVRAIPFVFVDCGANFGYWSARVASAMYGRRRTIAVEASSAAVALLRRNVEHSKNHVSIYNRAIDSVSNNKVWLYGQRHAGFSINRDWYGASKTGIEEILTITIDDLLALEVIDPETTPVLVKLDIEGVEARGLAGADKAISAQAAFIIEDAERRCVSKAIQVAFQNPRMRIYLLEKASISRIVSLGAFAICKGKVNSLQARGLNVLVTASPTWIKVLENSALLVLETG